VLYPQNGSRIVTIDSVTLLHPVYRCCVPAVSARRSQRGTGLADVYDICFYLSVFVCHKPLLYQNGWTDQAGFWHLYHILIPVSFGAGQWAVTLCGWAGNRKFNIALATFYKEIRVSPKIRIIPSETLSITVDLDNFTTVGRS